MNPTPNQGGQDSHNNHPQHHQQQHLPRHQTTFPPPPPTAFQQGALQYQLAQQQLQSSLYQAPYSPGGMAHQQQQSPFGTSSGYFRTFSQHSGSATPQGSTTAPPGTFREPQAIDSPAMASRTTPEASSSASHTAGPSPKGAPTPPSMSTLTSSSSIPGSSQAKRKRKDGKGKAGTVDQSEEDEAEKAKRTKTQRACDPCRRKKIRCDIIPDSEPAICQHCSQYRYDCTFYLPITETRFKKKRLEEAAAAASTSNGSTVDVKPVISRGPSGDEAPNGGIASASRVRGDLPMASAGESSKEVKIYGPTSLSFIMHSTPSIPVQAFENYDARYQETWEVGKTGDGFIQVTDHSPPQHPATLAKPLEYHRLDREVLASLINAYFQEVAPQFPVVSEAEFLSTPSPPPVLLYAICSVAAGRRGVPREVFDTLRAAVNQVIKTDDVLSTASVVNVQALLILGMSGDVHSVSIQSAMTAAWLRLGAAIRMAQDLGMHRAEAVKKNVELRRRLWGACVIADRWYGACFGHPFMIDVLDCDVRLPTPDDPNDISIAATKPNCYLAELIKLSILLGKVTKTIYSPSGLVHATDQIITQLLAELDSWKENLHPDLVFQGKDSILPAGLLHLFYTCVCMMFWRVFLRLSYRCPAHLKFSLTVPRWTQLVAWSKESIEWLDGHEECFDSWMFVAYAASSCALVQYHTWVRRRDPEAVKTLKLLRDCVQRWEASLHPGHMSARRKTAEIIILLYETTQLPQAAFNQPNNPQRLNPTVGVSDRPPGTENFRKLKFTKDPTRPGGGVFVADDKALAEAVISDLPLGTVVFVQAEDKDGRPASGVGPVNKVEDGAPNAAGGRSANSASDEVTSLMVNIAPLQTAFGGGPSSSNSTGGQSSAAAGSDNHNAQRFGSIFGPSSLWNSMPDLIAGQVPADFPVGAVDGFSGAIPATKPQPSTTVSNVNPSMNYNYAPVTSGAVNGWQQLGNGGVQVLNLLDQPLDGSVVPYQMLQGIPFDTFNTAGWDEYFARIASRDNAALPHHASGSNNAGRASSTPGNADGGNGGTGGGRTL
ncbi:hypothetical protein M407DRAFT_105584 [Tulasnella calospora MUT 4182]|uniref:Zn(2)-C6 fungal-type domain-containing protein n=1 Tax=Tulasnella calospora MUT 4182 TaxID=1051891 RepID=A0A0C3MFS9_9AGAM|nr:hypothetical protein M407DRAFT_105584 [Tulasnella calospora MUT 4182]